MKFSVAAVLATLASVAIAQTAVSVSYDNIYDTSTESLNYVACSDGTNGLETKGYTTIGSLPDFPYVGGAYTVTGWNSDACGTCYAITYGSTTINVLAIDTATEGFNLSEEAMNALTDNQAAFLGRVNATAVPVAASVCGL